MPLRQHNVIVHTSETLTSSVTVSPELVLKCRTGEQQENKIMGHGPSSQTARLQC